MEYIIIIIIVAFIVWFFLSLSKYKKEEGKGKSLKALEIQNVKEKERETDLMLSEKYGKCTKVIEAKWNPKLFPKIRIYENTKVILIGETEIPFSSLISSTIRDEQIVTRGNSKQETKTSGTSLAGRAMVGALIAGPAGAIIGGTTAKKKTVVKNEPDSTKHYYSVDITTDDISNPLLTIKVGSSLTHANEIDATIKAIIHKYNK